MTEREKPSKSGSRDASAKDAQLPRAWPSLALLLAINLFNYIDRQVLSAVVPDIRTHFFGPHAPPPGGFVQFLLDGLGRLLGSDPQNAVIGLLAMIFIVSYMLAAPLFAMLKAKRWWIIAGGVALWSLASGATGLATTFGLLLLTRCFVGIGEAAYGPIAPTVLSDLYPVETRGRVMSWFYLAIPVGSALGFVLGGLVGSCWGWQWAFFVVVPPGILLALLCLFMREPASGQTGSKEAVQHGFSRNDIAELAATPSYVLDTLGMALMTFAIGGIAFWMPSYITEYRGAGNLGEVNFYFGTILVFSGLAGTLTGGWLADRLQPRYSGSYFLVSGIAMLVGMPLCLAIPFVPFPWAWACIFGACFCLFFNTGPTNTILANVTRPSLRASAFALNILVIHALGDVISPMVLGAITDVTGSMDTAITIVGVLVGAGGLLWIWGARYLERDTKAITESSGS